MQSWEGAVPSLQLCQTGPTPAFHTCSSLPQPRQLASQEEKCHKQSCLLAAVQTAPGGPAAPYLRPLLEHSSGPQPGQGRVLPAWSDRHGRAGRGGGGGVGLGPQVTDRQEAPVTPSPTWSLSWRQAKQQPQLQSGLSRPWPELPD